MLKVLHGADFHLDSPFSGLKPDAAARRRGEQRELLARLTDLAREREADLVLPLRGPAGRGPGVPGDRPGPGPGPGRDSLPCIPGPGQPRLVRSPVPLCRAGVAGNVHLFTGPELGAVRLPELGCTVWGSGLLRPPAERLPPAGLSCPGGGGPAGRPPRGGGRPGTTAPSRRRTSPPAGWTTWPWAMSTSTAACAGQGRLSGLTPAAPRGVALTSWEKRACSGWRWRRGGQRRNSSPLCRRRYQILSVDLTGQADPAAAVLAALPPHRRGRTSTASSSPGSGD